MHFNLLCLSFSLDRFFTKPAFRFYDLHKRIIRNLLEVCKSENGVLKLWLNYRLVKFSFLNFVNAIHILIQLRKHIIGFLFFG